jgi:hypothetical protein
MILQDSALVIALMDLLIENVSDGSDYTSLQVFDIALIYYTNG